MKSLSGVLVTVGLLIPLQVFSGPVSTPMSASHLFTACNESDNNDYSRGFCDGAIDALYSSIQDWCVPASVTHGEVKARIKSDLLSSGHSLSIGAFEFVNRSIQKAWPCQ